MYTVIPIPDTNLKCFLVMSNKIQAKFYVNLNENDHVTRIRFWDSINAVWVDPDWVNEDYSCEIRYTIFEAIFNYLA